MTRSRLAKDNKLTWGHVVASSHSPWYELDIAQNKREGFRPAGSHMPDIILLDLSLARNGRMEVITPHQKGLESENDPLPLL